jgi:hypothetical protein
MTPGKVQNDVGVAERLDFYLGLALKKLIISIGYEFT